MRVTVTYTSYKWIYCRECGGGGGGGGGGDNKTGLHMAIKSQSHNALQYVNDLTFDSDVTVCCQ